VDPKFTNLILSAGTYLKKSSLQNNWPFLIKHFSFNWVWHSLHCKHFACQVRSDTLSINRSTMNSWQPPHFGIVAARKKNGKENLSTKCRKWKMKIHHINFLFFSTNEHFLFSLADGKWWKIFDRVEKKMEICVWKFYEIFFSKLFLKIIFLGFLKTRVDDR
jgi:hypothetical protein